MDLYGKKHRILSMLDGSWDFWILWVLLGDIILIYKDDINYLFINYILLCLIFCDGRTMKCSFKNKLSSGQWANDHDIRTPSTKGNRRFCTNNPPQYSGGGWEMVEAARSKTATKLHESEKVLKEFSKNTLCYLMFDKKILTTCVWFVLCSDILELTFTLVWWYTAHLRIPSELSRLFSPNLKERDKLRTIRWNIRNFNITWSSCELLSLVWCTIFEMVTSFSLYRTFFFLIVLPNGVCITVFGVERYLMSSVLVQLSSVAADTWRFPPEAKVEEGTSQFLPVRHDRRSAGGMAGWTSGKNAGTAQRKISRQ